MKNREWISTGEAVKLMGGRYSGRHFRRKFADVLPNWRVNGGDYRWLRTAVEALAPKPLAA